MFRPPGRITICVDLWIILLIYIAIFDPLFSILDPYPSSLSTQHLLLSTASLAITLGGLNLGRRGIVPLGGNDPLGEGFALGKGLHLSLPELSSHYNAHIKLCEPFR